MSEGNDRRHSLLPVQLRKTSIPKAFIKNDDSRWVLCDIISDFHHNEKQAIYYCTVFDATVEDIAKKIELSPKHVASVLELYSERLESKLDFFKMIMPYDKSELLPISEMLFLESAR